jgi:DNA-directed RNA polymerase specialized sigma24 family protein
MLEELAKENKKWRGIAYAICKDYDTANDLVQDMYIKLMDMDVDKYRGFTNAQQCQYVKNSMYFMYIDDKRKIKDSRLEGSFNVADTTNNFEPDDQQQAYLDEYNNLDWYVKELFLESLDKSYRQINKEFNINYGFTYRKVKEAKETILNTKTR